jgi:hypothetical protein
MEEATEEQKAGIRLLRYEPNSPFSTYLYVRQDCLNFLLYFRRPKKTLVITKDEGAAFDPMKYVKF